MNEHNVTPHYLLLLSGEAKKIGIRSTGKIRFQILSDTARQSIFLRLAGNDSSGCFSTELVDFTGIENCVKSVQEGRPLASKALSACFSGRSANNGSFLCAALRSLGLLAPVPENMNLSQMAGDWAAWKKTMLEAEGSDFTIPPKEKPLAGKASGEISEGASKLPEHSERPKASAKNRTRGKGTSKEDSHADCPANE